MLFACGALPMSIYDNVVYGPRLTGVRQSAVWMRSSRKAFQAAFLWDEVKDR